MNHTTFYKKLQALVNRANYVYFRNKKYLLIKVDVEELERNDIVSGNYYFSIKKGILKPYEISDAKVSEFVFRSIRS